MCIGNAGNYSYSLDIDKYGGIVMGSGLLRFRAFLCLISEPYCVGISLIYVWENFYIFLCGVGVMGCGCTL